MVEELEALKDRVDRCQAAAEALDVRIQHHWYTDQVKADISSLIFDTCMVSGKLEDDLKDAKAGKYAGEYKMECIAMIEALAEKLRAIEDFCAGL